MVIGWDYSEKVREYKPYKNEQFNKKLAKAKSLLNSIDDTSLKKEDKVKLKNQISELFK